VGQVQGKKEIKKSVEIMLRLRADPAALFSFVSRDNWQSGKLGSG